MLWDILASSAESPQEAQLLSPDQLSAGLVNDYFDRIINMVFSPDGKTLVSHADDGETKMWNVGTGCCALAQEIPDSHKPFFESPITASAWVASPSGGEHAVMLVLTLSPESPR